MNCIERHKSMRLMQLSRNIYVTKFNNYVNNNKYVLKKCLYNKRLICGKTEQLQI